MCADVLPRWYPCLCTKRIVNLQCGASVRETVTLCAAVACLAWDGWIGERRGAALAGAAL
ncbi:MAG: hypothetical protein IJT94_06270 [Oscillibacter sp.]|nr:hypothetical protein [Oscillibacter sp.]